MDISPPASLSKIASSAALDRPVRPIMPGDDQLVECMAEALGEGARAPAMQRPLQKVLCFTRLCEKNISYTESKNILQAYWQMGSGAPVFFGVGLGVSMVEEKETTRKIENHPDAFHHFLQEHMFDFSRLSFRAILRNYP